jgi:hypothetical protein
MKAGWVSLLQKTGKGDLESAFYERKSDPWNSASAIVPKRYVLVS